MLSVRFRDLWMWQGTVGRGAYALVGFVGFAVKHNLDRAVASWGFGRPWGLFNYWIPLDQAARLSQLPPRDAVFLGTMLLLALPFIWIGVVMTLKRLRSAGLPTWLVAVFFLPFVNLLAFLLLCLIPARPAAGTALPPTSSARTFLGRLIPDSQMGAAALSLAVAAALGVLATKLVLWNLPIYGWGLFVALPFCVGLFAVLLYGYHRPRGLPSCLVVSAAALGLVAAGLFALAVEGAVCLAMAAPIGIGLGMLGGGVGYVIQARIWARREAPALMLALSVMLPLLMGAEFAAPRSEPVFEVRTAIEIKAPPELVWKHLVEFPPLPEPEEWPFRAGIAYPISATVQGSGAGAVRACQFSTGQFVEPVEAWEEARLLRFSISAQPPVMREMSFYESIRVPHVDGHYLRPEMGEFILAPLPGGGTRLEGHSRYRNRMWPAAYWRLWSDAVVRRVHLRVFRHIQQLAEAEARREHAGK